MKFVKRHNIWTTIFPETSIANSIWFHFCYCSLNHINTIKFFPAFFKWSNFVEAYFNSDVDKIQPTGHNWPTPHFV